MNLKKLLGEEIARKVKDGQVIGIGSGTTAEEAIKVIGKRVQTKKLTVYGVPTSQKVADLGAQVGIKVVKIGERKIDWGFDGADEVEKGTLNLIKGGGGAMTMEKKVAKKCPVWIVIVDQSKLVDKLGKKHPVPVEVSPRQMGTARYRLTKDYQPEKIEIRQKAEGGMMETDTGNRILDVYVEAGVIQADWEKEWEKIPGVVGVGLFLGGYPDCVWVADSSGKIHKIKGEGKR